MSTNNEIEEHENYLKENESKLYDSTFCLFFNTEEEFDHCFEKIEAIRLAFMGNIYDRGIFYVDNMIANSEEKKREFLTEFKRSHGGQIYPYRFCNKIDYEAGMRFSLLFTEKNYDFKVNENGQLYDSEITCMNGIYVYTLHACNIMTERDVVPYDKKLIRFHTELPWRGKKFNDDNELVECDNYNRVELALAIEPSTLKLPADKRLKKAIQEAENERKKKEYRNKAPEEEKIEVKDMNDPRVMEWIKNNLKNKQE